VLDKASWAGLAAAWAGGAASLLLIGIERGDLWGDVNPLLFILAAAGIGAFSPIGWIPGILVATIVGDREKKQKDNEERLRQAEQEIRRLREREAESPGQDS